MINIKVRFTHYAFLPEGHPGMALWIKDGAVCVEYQNPYNWRIETVTVRFDQIVEEKDYVWPQREA